MFLFNVQVKFNPIHWATALCQPRRQMVRFLVLYHYMYHTRSSWGNKLKIGETQERIVRVILLNSFDLWRASESKWLLTRPWWVRTNLGQSGLIPQSKIRELNSPITRFSHKAGKGTASLSLKEKHPFFASLPIVVDMTEKEGWGWGMSLVVVLKHLWVAVFSRTLTFGFSISRNAKLYCEPDHHQQLSEGWESSCNAWKARALLPSTSLSIY